MPPAPPPPYSYMGLLETYLACRRDGADTASSLYYPSLAPPPPAPSEKLVEGTSALTELTTCKDDVEKGGVLPALVAVMSAVDFSDAQSSASPNNFILPTMQVYPFSLFLQKEFCASLSLHSSTEPDKSALLNVVSLLESTTTTPTENDSQPSHIASLLNATLRALKCVTFKSSYPSSSKTILNLPPIWLAYCDYDSTSTEPDSLPSRYESLTAVTSLIRSFRVALLAAATKVSGDNELQQSLFGAYIHTIDTFFLSFDSSDPYSFTEYFASSKSRLHALRKELEDERENVMPDNFKNNELFESILSKIDTIMNSPSTTSPFSSFHTVLQKTSGVLQRKLADSNLSAPFSSDYIPEDSSVLAGGFQSGYGDASFVPVISKAVAERKAAERKLPAPFNTTTKSWIPIYERFLSECPTVPEIWLDYARNLVEAAYSNSPTSSSPNPVEEQFFYDLAKDVVQRGIKNIPWSTELHKLRVSLITCPKPADEDAREKALQRVSKMVARSTKSGFLTHSNKVGVWLAGCKEYRLMLVDALLKKGDQTSKNDDDMDKDDMDEDDDEDAENLVEDMISELREFYSKAEKWAKENKSNKKMKDSKIIRSRAFDESFLICEDGGLPSRPPPLDAPNTKAVDCWEKLITANRFSYTTWNDYTSYMLNRYKVYGLQQISQLLRRAFTSMCGREGDKAIDVDGCRRIGKRFVEFEEEYNTLVWALRAKSLVEGKMNKLGGAEDKGGASQQAQVEAQVEEQVEAPKIEDAPPEKKRKRDDGEAVPANSEETKTKEEEEKTTAKKGKKKAKHFVMVGDLKWPAHPTTVHITNLHPDANEIDVSEVFKKCGELVKVRVLREKEFVNGKKQFTKSKERALVQFIDPESVEEALKYNDSISIKEQIVNVERSRLAAVEPIAGKAGEKKKGKKGKGGGGGEGGANGANGGEGDGGEKKKKIKKPTIFKPRNVVKKGGAVKEKKVKLGEGKGNDGVPKGNAAFAAMFD